MAKRMFTPHVEVAIPASRRPVARTSQRCPCPATTQKETSELSLNAETSDWLALDAVAALFPESDFATLRRMSKTVSGANYAFPVPPMMRPPQAQSPRREPNHTQLRSLRPMERFEGKYLLRNPQRLTRCDGTQYWKLVLADKTGWLIGYLWPEQHDSSADFLHGEEIFVEARARIHDGRLIADILSVDRCSTRFQMPAQHTSKV